jgi:hypothetical protein
LNFGVIRHYYIIIKFIKLFVENHPYSDILKGLIVINTPDILTVSGDLNNNPEYTKKINEMSIKKLRDQEYIRLEPRLNFKENNEVKSYILITFDGFSPTDKNDYYRDCVVMIDVICHVDYWDLGNFRIRPFRIAGIIDGILNGSKMSGLGTLAFMGCNEIVLSEELAGYCLTYAAVHGIDDAVEEVENDESEEESPTP